MSGENLCNDCKHFTGYDGVNELWTGCTYGDFKGSKKVCKNYNKKTTKTDLQNRIKELEEEKVELMEDCACQYREIQKLESENDDLRTKMKELHDEKEDWKNNCLKSVSENSILWNEISILMEQGALPSDAFKNYLNNLKNKNKKLEGDFE